MMKEIILSLIIVIGRVEGCIEPVFQLPSLKCPGTTAVFTCKSHDPSELPYHRTVWEVNESIAPYGGCPLHHQSWPDVTAECGSFHARATEESPVDCFVSELSVTVTLGLNGTLVTCYYVDDGPSTNRIRGSGILQVIGPIETVITAISRADISHGTNSMTRSVRLHWNISQMRRVTRYSVRVSPATAPCDDDGECVIEKGENGFNNRVLNLEIILGLVYSVSVSTVNCGTQIGTYSNPHSIILLYPPSPSCYAQPHYHDGSLFSIEITWDSLLSVNALLDVEYYSIKFQSFIMSPILLSPLIACTSDDDDECYYNFNVSSLLMSNMSTMSISVMMSAINAVGEGQTALCNAYPIDINSSVSVDSTTGPYVTIIITFPPHHVNKSCSLLYGLNTTVQSTIFREYDYTIQYTLIQPLIAGLTYSYKVSCSVVNEIDQIEFKFVEMGSFTPGCFLKDLIPDGNNVVHINQLCLDLPQDGIVCYNGHFPGAIAVYMCSNGDYTLKGNISRVCMEDGMWSEEEIPECVATFNHTYFNTTNDTMITFTTTASTTHTVILVNQSDCESTAASSDIPRTSKVVAILISTVLALCIMSCVIGALFHWILASHLHCGCLRSKKESTVSGDQINHVYDEIDLTAHVVHGTEVGTSQDSNRDVATSGHDNNIVTTNNKAYQQVKLA